MNDVKNYYSFSMQNDTMSRMDDCFDIWYYFITNLNYVKGNSMFYAAERDSLTFATIKPFDTEDDMKHWVKWNDRFPLSADVAEEIIEMRRRPHAMMDGILISLCDPDNDDYEPIDKEYPYYAIEDGEIDKLDIECFRTAEERDEWCATSTYCYGIPISRKLAAALYNSYKYIEDITYWRDGIVFLRV